MLFIHQKFQNILKQLGQIVQTVPESWKLLNFQKREPDSTEYSRNSPRKIKWERKEFLKSGVNRINDLFFRNFRKWCSVHQRKIIYTIIFYRRETLGLIRVWMLARVTTALCKVLWLSHSLSQLVALGEMYFLMGTANSILGLNPNCLKNH